ncbi:Synaptophysin / synaptoporin [Trichostrongylus colubriformis]|uniref:Synaptophysin / synaptoporin n=1 Tax=Trichostrongylus colubriformis TaxID=6319 RepID=A0AAN8FKX8_TRICO
MTVFNLWVESVLIPCVSTFSGAGWATFVSSVGLCVSTSLLFLYLFRVVDALPQVPWIVGEMCFCFAWTIFFFIAACVLAVAAARFAATGGWAVAAFFAFGAMCAYGFDCYLKFLSWKNNEVATGGGGRDFIAEQRRRAQNL